MSLTWVEVSKSALAENIGAFRKLAQGSKIMAVVKSNAYGHGIDLVPAAIAPLVDWFGVSSAEEGIFLRDQGISKPILVLSYYEDDLIEEVLRKNISVVVYDNTQIEALNKAASKLKTKASVHLKIDTGMSRLGVPVESALEFILKINSLPGLHLEGIMTHFAAGDDKPKATKGQFAAFEKVLAELKSKNISIPYVHMAATAAAVSFPESRQSMIRLGIGMYGLASYKIKDAKNAPRLKPALAFKTRIIFINPVKAGSFVGYGLTYKALKPETIAILPVGYYEGYDRKFSNNAEVLVNGVKCPIRGRISMNLMAVGVDKAGHVKIGDEAVLIGRQGKQAITADDLAAYEKTINHEIITRINPNLPRVLVA